MKKFHRLCILILAISSVSPFVFSQDFTGTWSFYANGYKWELYLKQDGNQVRGWMGVNGVNLDSDTITGTVNGNEILFTRSNPQLPRPQEFHGFIMLHDNPQIEARRRMTGADAMAGIFSHMGEWKYAWYATRLGPYREPPGNVPPNVTPAPPSTPGSLSIGGAWTCDGQPTSITQDASGNLVFTNQMGWLSKGRFLNTDTVIATEWEGGLHGSVQDGGKTIRWANGTVWSRSLPGAGTGSGGGSGSLGVRWDESENGFSGVWTRRGTSDVFDAAWDVNGRSVTAVLTMTRIGSDTVSIYRKDTSDDLEVDYTATIGKDGSVTGSGKVRSTGLAFNWTARVRAI